MSTFNIVTLMVLMMFMIGTINFVAKWNHILSTLISLEFLVLFIYMMMTLVTFSNSKELYITFFFLAITACEGALGLTMLILFSRMKGTEMADNVNLVKW